MTPDSSDPADKQPPPQKPFGQRLRSAFNKASAVVQDKVAKAAATVQDTVKEFRSDAEPQHEWIGVLKDSAKDIKSNQKELTAFAISSVIPGGWIVYGAHRVHKYREKKSANDDAPPQQQRPQQANKPPQP